MQGSMSMTATVEPTNKKTILIADDDDATGRLLATILRAEYNVTRVTDGLSAIVRLQQFALPSLLLLDVNMPKLDGFAVARAVRALPGGAKIPILFLSANAAPQQLIKAIQHGARHFIAKPFDRSDLLLKIKKSVMP
jgi:CheY-like chemotaxis protein